MAKRRVLVVEDKESERETIVSKLEQEYDVEAPEGQTHTEFFHALKKLHHAGDTFDFLILDMDFANNPFGGISLRNDIARAGFDELWNNLVVCSEYVTQDILSRDLTDDGWDENEFAYKIFLDTLGLGKANVLNGRISLWIERLTILLAELESQGR